VWKYLLVQRKSNITGRYVSYFGFSNIGETDIPTASLGHYF
jgi:hypothetical protein